MSKAVKVALMAGGYSKEYEVSLKSQRGIRSFLEGSSFEVYDVLITKDKWVLLLDGKEYLIDRNDFSVALPSGDRLLFDYVYMTIHGTPGEDGLMTGYLDMLGIPYSCCPTAIGALTFNKHLCKNYLHSFGLAIAPGIRLLKGEKITASEVEKKLGLPVFIKPNVGGSSVATTKVIVPEAIEPAIETAFAEADEVMIEALITGTEVTCGAFEDYSGLNILPVTEVVPKNEFFDFDAKYNGAVEEITPARISPNMTDEIQQLTREIYRHLGAKGIIRVDYIIQDDIPYLLEVNTTPGMTTTSFIPQQVAADGRVMRDVLECIMNFHIAGEKRKNLI